MLGREQTRTHPDVLWKTAGARRISLIATGVQRQLSVPTSLHCLEPLSAGWLCTLGSTAYARCRQTPAVSQWHGEPPDSPWGTARWFTWQLSGLGAYRGRALVSTSLPGNYSLHFPHHQPAGQFCFGILQNEGPWSTFGLNGQERWLGEGLVHQVHTLRLGAL